MQDLRSKIDYWIKRDDERLAIGKAGKERAYKDHTYELRLNLLIDTLMNKAIGFELPVGSV